MPENSLDICGSAFWLVLVTLCDVTRPTVMWHCPSPRSINNLAISQLLCANHRRKPKSHVSVSMEITVSALVIWNSEVLSSSHDLRWQYDVKHPFPRFPVTDGRRSLPNSTSTPEFSVTRKSWYNCFNQGLSRSFRVSFELSLTRWSTKVFIIIKTLEIPGFECHDKLGKGSFPGDFKDVQMRKLEIRAGYRFVYNYCVWW